MGSIAQSGVKQPYTFRKMDNFITRTDNRCDTETQLVTWKPDEHRALGSGSIVRESGVADYYDELVIAVQRMWRSSEDRVASATSGVDRVVVVDLDGNTTRAVIEASLSGNYPQRSAYKLNNTVVRAESVTDTIIDRVSGVI